VWLDNEEVFKLLAALLGRSREIGERWSDLVKAYGPTCYHFLLLLGVCVILSLLLRKLERPYASERQKLFS
jgi:hypothetical protein